MTCLANLAAKRHLLPVPLALFGAPTVWRSLEHEFMIHSRGVERGRTGAAVARSMEVLRNLETRQRARLWAHARSVYVPLTRPVQPRDLDSPCMEERDS